jgi:outer membrane protein assembly factor BamB
LIGNGTGELVALDVNDGSVRWQANLMSTPFASVIVVNDLLLTSTLDANLLAFNRNTGAEGWRTQLPNGSNGPITVVDNLVLVPAGIGPGASQLLALKLP